MAEFTNGLTQAEAERLALLIEECGEVIQSATKILRHGYENHHPDRCTSNRSELATEIGDLLAARYLMQEAGDIDVADIAVAQARKLERVGRYLHHQPAPGGETRKEANDG